MRRSAIFLAAAFWAGTAFAQELKPEKIEQLTLGDFPRVYVADPALPHMIDGRIYVLDADMNLKGMIEAGFAGMLLAVPARHQVYVPATFYERGTRGRRTDVIQIFDDRTLSVVDEIPVAPTRAQALTYRNLFRTSVDGSLLFLQNATPATSINVVDVATRKQLEAQNPGCYGIYPALKDSSRFSTLCGTGTVGTFTLNAARDAATRKTSGKLFDAGADPWFTHAERDSDAYLFLSFKGKLTRVSLDGETAVVLDTADLGREASGWAPGGFQPFALDAKNGVVYVLMHGDDIEGSHKNPSAEIWSYDLKAKKLLARSPVAGLASITVSPVDPTILFAINLVESKVQRLAVDPATRKIAPAKEIKLGETAALIEATP